MIRWEKGELKRFALRCACLFAMLGVVGFLVVALGLPSIKASSGHWPITRWFLNFSMARSVKTHSVAIKVPDLSDPGLVVKGAGHFEIGCGACHGRPGLTTPVIPGAMTPHPPYLPPKISEWEAEELFYIVKHGVKFTGMPAWASQKRDDEVWAVVAFLLELPGMTEARYLELAHGDSPTPRPPTQLSRLSPTTADLQSVLMMCASCHGADGDGRGHGVFPKLAGQRAEYVYRALRAYATGGRHSGIMQPVAAALNDGMMQALAEHYASMPQSIGPAIEGMEEAIDRGRMIAMEGVAERKVPSCVDCHGPAPAEKNPAYPKLAGQYPEYLMLQLDLFKKGNRGGSEYARLMHKVAPKLTEEQMRDVALYYGALSAADVGE